MDEINQYERAGLAWTVLTRIASQKTFIRYKKLGDEIGIHHRVVRFVLGVIQEYCLQNQLPPITILVTDANGIPGTGFKAWDVDNIDEGFQKVYDYNWNNLDNPFSYALTGQTEDEIIDELLNEPENSESTYARIKVRGTAQTIFRKALLKAYGSKCTFCGLSFPFALEAAHIIPWAKATNSQRLDVRNGLLLCATHHCLYDAGVLTVNRDYSINFIPSGKHRLITQYDNLLSSAFHNQKIKLPKKNQHLPNPEFLDFRNSNIE